jgi:hypothetical protein
MGTIKGSCLLCEDSIVFHDNLIYSLVTKTKSLIYAIPAEIAYSLPNECQKAIKLSIMEKYGCFNERILRTEEFLHQNDKKEKIWMAAMVEKKSKMNYPVATERVRDTIKTN